MLTFLFWQVNLVLGKHHDAQRVNISAVRPLSSKALFHILSRKLFFWKFWFRLTCPPLTPLSTYLESPQSQGPLGFCYWTQFVLRENPEMLRFAAERGFIHKVIGGRRQENKSQGRLPKARGWGIYRVTNKEAGPPGRGKHGGKVIGKRCSNHCSASGVN